MHYSERIGHSRERGVHSHERSVHSGAHGVRPSKNEDLIEVSANSYSILTFFYNFRIDARDVGFLLSPFIIRFVFEISVDEIVV